MPTANQMLLESLTAKREIAAERERELRKKSSADLTCFAKQLLHGQVEYVGGKVQAFDEAIELVEAAERAVRLA